MFVGNIARGMLNGMGELYMRGEEGYWFGQWVDGERHGLHVNVLPLPATTTTAAGEKESDGVDDKSGGGMSEQATASATSTSSTSSTSTSSPSNTWKETITAASGQYFDRGVLVREVSVEELEALMLRSGDTKTENGGKGEKEEKGKVAAAKEVTKAEAETKDMEKVSEGKDSEDKGESKGEDKGESKGDGAGKGDEGAASQSESESKDKENKIGVEEEEMLQVIHPYIIYIPLHTSLT